MKIPTLRHQRPRVFFGWWMVSLSGFVHSLNASAFTKGYTVFLLPVSEGLGVSRASISLIFSLSRSEGGPIGPIAGWLVDRFGPKPILMLGTAMTGTGFILLSQTNNILTFGLVYLAVITIGSDLAFSNSLQALINNWFIRRRALAMSTYQSISSLTPAILVPLLAILIASQGWRTAAMVAGITILALALPLSLLVRNTPESAGLLPDGAPARPSRDRPSLESQERDPEKDRLYQDAKSLDYGIREALHTRAYWLLLMGTILRLSSKAGVMLHIIPILVWKGTDEQSAAFIFGFLLFLQVPFFLFFGWLADTIPKNVVLFITSIVGTTSFILLAYPFGSIWVVYLFVLFFAIADTSGSTNWVTFGDYFGREAFGRLRGFTQLASSPGVLLAPVFAGWWYDRVENYTLPLWIFSILYALGALSFALMRKPNRVQVATEGAPAD